MRTLIDFAEAPVFAIPMLDGTIGEGMLIEGPQGWGEFSPDPHADEAVAARWLTAAMEPGTVGWPDPVRGRVPVAVTVPAVAPDIAHRIVASSGCRTVDVSVTGHTDSLGDDIARVEAVRDALGTEGAVRCDVRGGWDVETAVRAVATLDRAAGGLEFVVQPCRTLDELALLRRKVGIRVAADGQLVHDVHRGRFAESADLVVLTCGPMGGVRRALRFAEQCGVDCVVSSAAHTSIGLAAGLALAGALPELPYACALGTRPLHTGDVVSEARSLVPVDGHLPAASMPPAPDSRALAQFAVTDADRVRRWRDRLRVVAGR